MTALLSFFILFSSYAKETNIYDTAKVISNLYRAADVGVYHPPNEKNIYDVPPEILEANRKFLRLKISEETFNEFEFDYFQVLDREKCIVDNAKYDMECKTTDLPRYQTYYKSKGLSSKGVNGWTLVVQLTDTLALKKPIYFSECDKNKKCGFITYKEAIQAAQKEGLRETKLPVQVEWSYSDNDNQMVWKVVSFSKKGLGTAYYVSAHSGKVLHNSAVAYAH